MDRANCIVRQLRWADCAWRRCESRMDRANYIGEKHYDTEPETDWSTRMGVELLSILPIEWLL